MSEEEQKRPTWKQLFSYIGSTTDRRTANTFGSTVDFCEDNNLPYDEVEKILLVTGGSVDDECWMNSLEYINKHCKELMDEYIDEIGKSKISKELLAQFH